MRDTTAKNPFEYRTTPKSNWELIWWALTDADKFDKYIDSLKLNKQQERLFLFKIYLGYVMPLAAGLTVIFWLAGIVCIALLNLPTNTPTELWKEDILIAWTKLPDFTSKFNYLFIRKIIWLATGFAVGSWTFGLIGYLFFGLARSIAFSIVGSLGGGLTLGLFAALGAGLTVGLAVVMIGNLIVNLAVGLLYSLIVGLFFGLIYNLNVGVAFSLIVGLAIGLIWGSIYLSYVLISRFSKLDNNLYLVLNNIDVSIMAEKHLIKQTQEKPILALEFVIFLLRYRDKNYNLAVLLAHIARATLWKEAALNLEEKKLKFSEFERKGFSVPEKWHDKLIYLKNYLLVTEQTNQISQKKELFAGFLKALEEFILILSVPRQLTWRDKISMTRRIDWQQYYREAIEEWIRVAQQKLAEYEEIAKRAEPIARNFYLTGDALTPNRNEAIFINRIDLHNELSLKIHTTNSLAVLFLQGQRRVGKTSLIRFLPKILGRRFEVVSLDLQGNITSIEDFLFKLRREFDTKLAITEKTEWLVPSTWAAALHELYAYIGEYAKEKDVKIILAIDEYEYLQQHLSKDLAQAQEFLGAFRHFSQHQDHISLMFVGLKFFSELQNPNWNEYFVNAVSIRVDYLNQEESFKLIEVSKLDFEAGAKEKIFELTQGHPALIQKICYEIVNIANVKGSKHITWADVEKALKIMIYVSVNGVTDIFWTQTCELPEDKEVVWAIIEKREIPKTHRLRLRRLIEYGFIVENEAENSYALRVPIFSQWVKKFG